MKIVHVIDFFPIVARFQEYYLATYQARMGHQVTVITSNQRWRPLEGGCPKANVGGFLLDGFSLRRLPSLVNFRGAAVVLRGLGNELRSLRPDVVHVHGMTYKITGWQVSLHKKCLGYKLIFDVHAAAFNTHPKSDVVKRLYHWLHVRTLAKSMVRSADAIVAIGEEERSFICREFSLPMEQVQIIPLGVDCELFRPNRELRERTRNQLGISSEDIAIIHTGKMSPRKDIHVLVMAVSRMLSTYPQLRLLLVGREEKAGYRDYIMQLARDTGVVGRLIWVDFSPVEELAAYLAASDIAVWPGDPSIGILEAMASGLPLLLADDTSYASCYTRFGNGLPFTRGADKELADKLEVLLHSEIREEMGVASRRLAVEDFGWDIISRRFLKVYSGAPFVASS